MCHCEVFLPEELNYLVGVASIDFKYNFVHF